MDMCKLNSQMVKDAYSLPSINETLDCLNDTKIFTSLDLKSRYWQVELDEEVKPLTAFTIDLLGIYECKSMVYGLTTVPVTFQRMTEMCLEELHLSWCFIYLDNIIIFSKTPKECIQCLRGVFQKLAEARLKLKPSIWDFFHEHIMCLGHVDSHEGIERDP